MKEVPQLAMAKAFKNGDFDLVTTATKLYDGN
jgi:hypothetical protein